MNNKLFISVGLILVAVISFWSIKHNSKTVDYNTQIKPILNKHCIICHGGVKRQADFSLLFRVDALAKTKSGKPAIIPGDPEHSEFIRRLSLKDPEDRMPFKSPPLKPEEITLLTRWVKEGAIWGDHWAYLAPKAVEVPNKSVFAGFSNWFGGSWEQNDIDYFVKNSLENEGLKPSKEAEKTTLLRRVCLDLTGLPPTKELMDRFLANPTKENYTQIVDELLSSPTYGERWAGMWLDLARYADSKGYERDANREIWHYRDYLIRSFNQDKPYNQFITEQLAGDLLPNPTDEQLVATAFHRNTMTNDEGGTDNEEFRTAAILDRVNTTWEVLQSTTFACVQCHSHPYDPFRHEDYYKFAAFFNNSRDEDTYDDYPLLRHYKPNEQQKLDSVLKWINSVSPNRVADVKAFLKTWQPAYNSITLDKFVKSELSDTKFLGIQNQGSARIPNVLLDKKNILLYRFKSNEYGGTLRFNLDNPTGKLLASTKIDTAKRGWQLKELVLPNISGTHDVYVSAVNPTLKGKETYTIYFDWLSFREDFPEKGTKGYAIAKSQFWELMKVKTEKTPIMLENPKDRFRKSYVFERGNWTVKTQEVQPDVPHSLLAFPKNAPRNRLGLAQWMTAKQHPLTARTAVNRFWEQLFGVGLVETLEDFGTQGFTPSNPELLDYLSVKFMNEWNWQPKKLLREIVLSATYQQDSKASASLLEHDPMNRLLARGPRIRLSAEQVRDQALSISGLLSKKMFGPSVMPYQPDGVWASPYDGDKWKKSTGEDQYRRGLYTFWKRTSPYPSMISFDGASREVCLSRRIRTNTPLQALVTLNDSSYIEAARGFAKRIEREGGSDSESQIKMGYRLAMGHEIQEKKLAILENLYQSSLKNYQAKPSETTQLLACKPKEAKPQRAALTIVASAIMNLDEFITKE